MRTLELGRYRRARVWRGDLPDVTCASRDPLIRDFAAHDHFLYEPQKAAIELFVPLGARSMYGLLGGRFVCEATSSLHVEVFVSSAHERLFPESLASSTDEVRVGLPLEYGAAVFAGIEFARGDSPLTAGRLIVDHAAHGAVSSCIAIYKDISAVLLKLLCSPNGELSDNDLIALFPTEFK
jgi:hypothetical protein